MKTPYEFCKKVADISTDFEKTNTDLKRQYIISNIILYNNIASLIAECKGTFGTGLDRQYPRGGSGSGI